MNFKKATDELLASVTLADLAKGMGVSVQAIRQARSAEGTTSYRSPPEGWGRAVARLASQRAAQLTRLAKRLQSS
jgi:hypothetical protein